MSGALQDVTVAGCAVSVLLMMIVLRRSTASLERILMRIQSLVRALEVQTKKDSE